jgi:hypothetical protein
VSKTGVEPRVAEAQAGQRAVWFMEAAQVVLAPFWGMVWGLQRMLVKVPSGRQRLQVLAAVNAISHELFTIEHLPEITAETGCELWRLVAGAHQGIPITVILDNARYQRCARVHAVMQA